MKRILLLSAVLLTAFFSPRLANAQFQNIQGNWTMLGPTGTTGGGGKINSIAVDPANSNIIWITTPGGGVWKSTDSGNTWTVKTAKLPVPGASALAISPANSNEMYLGTGDPWTIICVSVGLLKSTDGGITWNKTGLTFPKTNYFIYEVLINPTNTNIVLAATSKGLYKSTDAGATWNQTLKDTCISDIEFKPGDPNTVYATAMGLQGYFFRSTNAGTSFKKIIPAYANLLRYSIGVSAANPSYIYLLAAKSSSYGYFSMYRSTDGGNTFKEQSSSPNIIGSNGSSISSIVVNPTNAEDVYAGGASLYRSTNGGVNWSLVSTGLHSNVNAITFLPGSSTMMVAATEGGFFKTVNNATQWTDNNTGLSIDGLVKLNTSGNLTVTANASNGAYGLSNGTWKAYATYAGWRCAIDYTDPNIIYVSSVDGNILKSTNGGISFSTIVNAYNTGVNERVCWFPFIIHPTDHNTLLVGKRYVYRSIDGGANWTQLAGASINRDLTNLAAAPSNPNYIYATADYKFYASTDGATMVDKSSSLPTIKVTDLAVSNTNPSKLWVSCLGNGSYEKGKKVYSSTDGGSTWKNYSDGLPNVNINTIVYQNGSSDGLYAGTDSGVYYRTSTMSMWQPFYKGLPDAVVSDLEINYTDGKLRAATNGRGLWESTLANPNLAPPVAKFSASDGSPCKGTTVTFSDLSTNSPTGWYWTFSHGSPATSTLQNPTVLFDTVGGSFYTLTTYNNDGIAFKTSSVNVINIPDINIYGSSTLCEGSSQTIGVNTYGSGTHSFKWSTGQNVISFSINVAGTYTVTVTDGNGCKAVESKTIKVYPLPPVPTVTPQSSLTICQGDSIMLTSSTATSYKWSNGVTTQSVAAKTAGNYTVKVKDTTYCTSTSAITAVNVNQPQNGLALILQTDTLSSPYAQPNDWYMVSNATAVGSGSMYKVQQTGYYFSIGQDVNGCRATSDTVYVQGLATGMVTPLVSGINLYPNPTADNATLVYTINGESSVSIEVYDPLGRLVQTIVNHQTKAGVNETRIVTEKLGSGIYLVKLNSGDKQHFSKLVLIK